MASFPAAILNGEMQRTKQNDCSKWKAVGGGGYSGMGN